MISYHAVHIIPSIKRGSFVDKHHILQVMDVTFGYNGKKICNGDFSFLLKLLVLKSI